MSNIEIYSEDLLKIAKDELKAEYDREEIERIKLKLREKKTFWQKICPFKIVIVRR